ncbi:fatty acid desaturase-domain-containing protein [Aspergillus varians]
MAAVQTRPPNSVRLPSITTLRRAIPQHCFAPSTARSLLYLSRDVMSCICLGILALQIPLIESFTARIAAWVVYGILQGAVCTGLWIFGHECGHGAFSRSRWISDTVGWLVHSSLLVPYFSWRSSHARHHRYSGHITKDTAFVPYRDHELEARRASKWTWWLFEDTPIAVMLLLVAQQILGWPLYFLFYASAGSDTLQRKVERKWWRISHYDPTSLIYQPREAKAVLLSDMGLVIALTTLYRWATKSGTSMVVLIYGIPYLWVNHWMVTITYLQHTHPSVPRYEHGTWTFTQGALCTVDRDTGILGRYFFHRVMETHVVHHFFPKIPFYYADEATQAIIPLLGHHYHYETAPLMPTDEQRIRHSNRIPKLDEFIITWTADWGILPTVGIVGGYCGWVIIKNAKKKANVHNAKIYWMYL